MTPGELGQAAVVAVVALTCAVLLYRTGWFRGWRHGRAAVRETTAETLNHLSRLDSEIAPRRVQGSYQPYRTPRTPPAFPIVYDARDEDHG